MYGCIVLVTSRSLYDNDPEFLADRLDQLVASTDPIALDIWATSNILIPSFLANGFEPSMLFLAN